MKIIRTKNSLSITAMLLTAFIWGTSYIVIKDTLRDISPLTLMAIRFTLSTLILCALFYKKLKYINRRDILSGAVIGLFLFLSFLTLVIGIRYTTVSKQSFLIASFVVIVPFLARIFNKKQIDVYCIISTIFAVIGIGLLTLNSSLSLNIGDCISLLSSVCFACHMVAIEYFNNDSDPIVLTLLQFSMASILFIVAALMFEQNSLHFRIQVIGSLAYLIIIATVIAFVVQNIAQKYISSTSTALILTLEPVFGSILAIIFLKEHMTLQMINGAIVIFFSILLQETKLSFVRTVIVKLRAYNVLKEDPQ